MPTAIALRQRASSARGFAAAVMVALCLGVATLCSFIVAADQFALVTEFGKPVQVVTTPGLGFKYPYQRVRMFDRRIDVFAPPNNEFLTSEKTPVVAGTAILWRIADPRRFFETVFDRGGAQSRLSDVVSAELGGVIASHPLSAFVSTDPGAYRAEALLAELARKCRSAALRDFGVDLMDVKLHSFDFPKQNRARVYARMASERGQLSMKHRSEGEEAALKIRAQADGEKSRILTDAMKIAQQHRAEGDGESARIYAQALGQAPEFYRFLRTMEASKHLMPKGTTLVLPADSDLFGLLFNSNHFETSEAKLGKETTMK